MYKTFTARELVRLGRIAKHRCMFCLTPIPESYMGGDCEECGNPILSDFELTGVWCPFCDHQNPLPNPLDAENISCQNCGEEI